MIVARYRAGTIKQSRTTPDNREMADNQLIGKPRRRWTVVVTALSASLAMAVSTAIAVAAAPASAAPTVTPATAKQLMQQAIAAVRTETAFTIVTVESSGTTTLHLRTVSGKSGGLQSVSMSGRTGTPERLAVVLQGPTAYLKANEAALSDYMRFTPAAAAKEAGSWIGATSASTSKLESYFYQSLAAGLTVASAATELQLPGTLSLGPGTTWEGLRVLDIKTLLVHGKQTARGDLYVRATGKRLPVYESLTASTGVKETITLSAWGKQPGVEPPAKFAPLQLAWLSKAWGG